MDAVDTLSNNPNAAAPMRAKRAAQAPDHAYLHEVAVAYLARYAASAAAVRRVLHRRIERWALQTSGDRADTAALIHTAKMAAEQVVSALVRAGAINDAAYAASRARSLTRSGRSARAIAAYLLGRGIKSDLVAAEGQVSEVDEIAAALALARRRRIGPFRQGDADANRLQRESAIFARAGFSRRATAQALCMPQEQAEELVLRLRSS